MPLNEGLGFPGDTALQTAKLGCSDMLSYYEEGLSLFKCKSKETRTTNLIAVSMAYLTVNACSRTRGSGSSEYQAKYL